MPRESYEVYPGAMEDVMHHCGLDDLEEYQAALRDGTIESLIESERADRGIKVRRR